MHLSLVFILLYITKFELPDCLCILEPANILSQTLLTWNSYVIVVSPFKELLLPHLEEYALNNSLISFTELLVLSFQELFRVEAVL